MESEKLIKLLSIDKSINFKLVVTGTHLDKKYGYTIKEINNDKIKVDKKIKNRSSYYNENEVIKIIVKIT